MMMSCNQKGKQDRLQPVINAEGATRTSTDHKKACPQIEIKAIKLPSPIMKNNERPIKTYIDHKRHFCSWSAMCTEALEHAVVPPATGHTSKASRSTILFPSTMGTLSSQSGSAIKEAGAPVGPAPSMMSRYKAIAANRRRAQFKVTTRATMAEPSDHHSSSSTAGATAPGCSAVSPAEA
jgi:hypothetical protein